MVMESLLVQRTAKSTGMLRKRGWKYQLVERGRFRRVEDLLSVVILNSFETALETNEEFIDK